jgi:S1-C subfamily serine protease
MTDVAMDLSNALAAAVDRAAPSAVRVDGRRRAPAGGVVYRPDGLIVTAHHSLEWDEGIEVGLADGTTVAAAVVGRDPSTDLAVLRIGASALAPPHWSAAAPMPGHLVLAIGRSNEGPRAVHGIVTATGGAWRTPAGGRVDAYLETDIGLFPGYSGSLLVDASGAALGVNTAGLLRGAGVALPAPTIQRVVEALVTHGHVRRGYLGVGTMPVRLAAEQGAAGQEAGLIVVSVQPEAPADRAGLMLGDVLLTFDGHAMERPQDLVARLDDESVGRPALLSVLRAGQVREVTVTVGSRTRSAS